MHFVAHPTYAFEYLRQREGVNTFVCNLAVPPLLVSRCLANVDIHIHLFIHICMNTYIRAYIRTFMHACMHTKQSSQPTKCNPRFHPPPRIHLQKKLAELQRMCSAGRLPKPQSATKRTQLLDSLAVYVQSVILNNPLGIAGIPHSLYDCPRGNTLGPMGRPGGLSWSWGCLVVCMWRRSVNSPCKYQNSIREMAGHISGTISCILYIFKISPAKQVKRI